MKRIAIAVAGIALLGLSPVKPGHAEVNVNVNVGVPVVPVPVVQVPPPIVLSAPPEFIIPPALGFYVAVDIPFDLFRVGGVYYLYRDNAWYRGTYYNGPWRHVEHRHLPPGLRKHKYERIRYYRDEEYRRYRDDRDHYRGRRFKPEKSWKEGHKEHRRAEKERRKDDHRYEKEERKQRKDEYKHDKGDGRGHGKHGDRD